MSDNMRKSLVTQFVCSECGDYLSLSYNVPKKRSNALEGEDYTITGGSKVQSNIAIHPCKKCYGRALEPLEALRKALRLAEDCCE